MSTSEAASIKGLPDGGQQYLVIEGFGEEFDSAALHRLHGFWHVAITRDEADRHVGPFNSNSFLQLKAIETRKREIKDEATRNNRAGAIKKFLCGCESLRMPTLVLDQQVQGFTNGDVIIDNKYDGGSLLHRCCPQLTTGYAGKIHTIPQGS